MQMERERRKSIANGNGNHNFGHSSTDFDNGVIDHHHHYHQGNRNRNTDRDSLPLRSPSPTLSTGADGAVSYIEHPVSKLDTLAGVAIMYGVEVADIKKMNGLVTDLQMFALKSLQIPLPGRHPPSPCLSNGSYTPGQSHHTPPHRVRSELLGSFQSLSVKSSQWKVSPAMSSLQGYYGLKSKDRKNISEGFELAVYAKGSSDYLEDGKFPSASPVSNESLNYHWKSRSVVNALLDENGVGDIMPVAEARDGDSDKWSDKLVRRRQKSDVDFTSRTPEMLLEDNSSSGGFSSRTGKGLALRPKAATRTSLASDAEVGVLNPIPIGMGDSFVDDVFSGVRKSSSTSSLQDQDNGVSSIWPSSKWSLKPDIPLSAAAITKPIFDGLPKPITGRRNKAAID